MRPRRAMVLAAGLGERMRPLTETVPKPLIEVGGRAMLDRALDRLDAFGIDEAVVNLHYLGERIDAHLATRSSPKTSVSREEVLLDTGGGVARALDRLGKSPFFAINADIVWLDGPTPALERLARGWDDTAMDALLLMHRCVGAYGYDGRGDYFMDPDGALHRRAPRDVSPYVFTGVQILHPRLFEGAPDGAFSLNLLYDRAQGAERLFGIVHDGEWFHVGTPAALRIADDRLFGRPGAHDFHVG
ncbi:MAG: nucleotidyltransferase family protein [Defluviicoccus sp.]|nr:nucleotidyltransferase family protein [Defluviicoccus sp.]MDE0276329.1 nucleotidyltransferase family protein [Defluviicoccus sp.]